MYDVSKKLSNYGPKPGSLNIALCLSIFKTKVGILFIMSCLHINPPSRSTMQKLVNRLSSKVESVNQAYMLDNQKFVQLISKIRGEPPPPPYS